MGRRVLLLSINRYDFPYPVYPLGVAQLAGSLRASGHEVAILDFNLNPPPLSEVVRTFQPDLVGISLRNIDDALIQRRETFFDELEELCRSLRKLTPAPLVLGGSGFSIFPEVLLRRTGADYGIQGEGESPLRELLQALEQGQDVRGVPGLVHRTGDRVTVNPHRRLTAPERITPVAEDAGLDRFYLERSSMLNLQTQRGCALRCCYCTYPLLEGRKYRRRPGERVAEELADMARRGARYVFVVDSVFNTSATHVREVCEAILRLGVQISWCCFLRPKGLTVDLMQLMARAGLRHVEFGADSFCDSVLEAYGKQLTFEDIRQASELARRAGIDYAHFLICGGPGETRETLEISIENSRRLPGATVMARVGMRVYPGTPLFERWRRERNCDASVDLLEPRYYISPALSESIIFDRLREVARAQPYWIFEDPPPAYFKMAERLRARGVVGPLWAYFAMMQRLGGMGSVPATPG
jgi:radical SAM superfamily enzyme YgiQ (UPF0313 family)